MALKDMHPYLDNLVKECSEVIQQKSVTGIHTALKSLYRAIKKRPVQISNVDSLAEKEHEKIYFILKSLLHLLLNDDIPADVMLLCGTCLALFGATVFKSEFASSFLIYIYDYFDKNFSGKLTTTDSSKESLKKEITECARSFISDEKSCIDLGFKLCEDYDAVGDNSEILKTPSFQQIAILNGIVSCQSSELYSLPIPSLQNKPFLIFSFKMIHRCCLSPSIHQYHAFIVLLNWARMCEMHLNDCMKTDGKYFTTTGEVVQKLLSLLEANWQSPVKGVNGFIRELYKSVIRLNELECKNVGTNDTPLVQYLLKKTMTLSWKVKGKYFMLSVILQHVSYCKFFQDNPDVPLKIAFSLKANYISSAVAEVYKVTVMDMKKNDSEAFLSLEWCKWWREPILNCLHSNDRLLIQNVTNNILSWTMKQFPKSYESMMEKENQNEDDSVKLLLLRVAKENLPFTLGDKEINLIEKNLHHCDIQVRMEILSILCSSPKKSEPVKSTELDYVKIFIVENLNVDSAPFNQYLLTQLHTLLIRIRDSLAHEHRTKIQNKNSIDLSQMKFVDWLAHTAIQNTFPGACFQRRRLSLQLLNIIFDVFIESSLGNRRKENPSKAVEKVIKLAHENNLWLFFNNDMLTFILPCITDFADEIRSLCAKLLSKYSSWPTLDSWEDVTKSSVTDFALTLCNHPDYRNNDGGAHVCCIIFNRLCLQAGEGESSQALDFLSYLISLCKLQLEAAQEDFLSAAVNKPIHGILLALQYCLADSQSFLVKSCQYQKDKTFNFLKNLMYLCFSIVDYMLKVMKGENESYNCPSFCDIGKAMESLVLSKKKSLSNSVSNSTLIDELESNENSDYSTLCDMMLSCCWHSIKNSCFLLCELSSSVLMLDVHSIEKRKFLKEIADEFSSILINCRHRGVVEACCAALNRFCINILIDKSIFDDITMGLLKTVFENLSDSSKVSVTRRSAGLPLLFQAVVTSEESNVNRQLLPYTIENLLYLIHKPLPNSVSEKTDLPQAHAYHILKALVSDARLSQSILPYFDSIVPVCIAGFSSAVWAVRNGALQLFGVILPRVCGQKKVRDDNSEHNTVSAFELFARCPNLKTYLLQELTKCVNFHHEKRLCSELVPILSLLVKLMPEREDQRIFMMDFIPLLKELLNIPVWKVRDLTSSALSVLMQSSEILKLLEIVLNNLQNENVNSNEIHSMFLIVQKSIIRKDENILSSTLCIGENLKKIYTLMQEKLKCPLLLGVIFDMMMLISDSENSISVLKNIDRTDSIVQLSSEVGFSLFSSKSALMDLKMCTLQSLPIYLEKKMGDVKDVKIQCIQFLSTKLDSERTTEHFYEENNLKLWGKMLVSTLEYVSSREHPSVILETLKFIVKLCGDENIAEVILDSVAESVMESLEHLLDMESYLSTCAIAFTAWSICIRSVLKNPTESLKHQIEKWNLLFYTYCQPRSTDILRLQAASSLALLGPSLCKYLSSSIGKGSSNCVQIFIDICEGSLLLLQDEDEDIRNKACEFPSQIPHDYLTTSLQFNVGIQVVFQYMQQMLHSQPSYMLHLWNRLQNYPSTARILQSYIAVKKRNLFEQEYVNVFAEPHQLLALQVCNFKKVLSNLRNENYKLYLENVLMFLHDLKAELQDLHAVLSSINVESSNLSFTYHHQVYLSLKKLRCQVEVLLNETCTTSVDDPLHLQLFAIKEDWSNIEKILPSVTCWFLNTLTFYI